MPENASLAQQNVTNETMYYQFDEDFLHVNTFMISGIKKHRNFYICKKQNINFILNEARHIHRKFLHIMSR